MGREEKPLFSQPKHGAALKLLVKSGANQDHIVKITDDGIVVVALRVPTAQSTTLNNALLDFLSHV